jgi:hypothetical protein
MCNCNKVASKMGKRSLETPGKETCANPARGILGRRSRRNRKSRSAMGCMKVADARVRGMLAVSIVTVVLLNAVVAIFVPHASAVFEQLFQVLMLVVGYYFGRS